MNPTFENDWKPDPQLLSAYFDGELESRTELADMRARIQAWLMSHPDAAEESEGLEKLWLETTPVQPSASQMQGVLNRIDAQQHRRAASSRRPWLVAGAIAASVVLFVGVLYGTVRTFLAVNPNVGPVVIHPHADPLDELDVLNVALASEVTILRFEGDDTNAVVVGDMPVTGVLAWADPGEVCISCKCPRVNVRQDPPHRPMVWPRVGAE